MTIAASHQEGIQVSASELLDSMHVVSIPTRTRFRGVSVREAVIFRGGVNWSEFSPFLEYDDAESSNWLRGAIEFGWSEAPSLLRDEIEVNATVPAVSASEVPKILDRFAGCATVKVKVAEKGQGLSDDISRVQAVRDYLDSHPILAARAKIRIDANGGWTPEEAFAALTELERFDLDYAEQPVMSLGDLALIRREFAGRIPIAADESVRKADDPLAVSKARAADLLIVKVQPLSGISSAQKIIDASGLPVVVSSALDTSVGISMGLHLAASLPETTLHGACGLGTVALLAGDVTPTPLLANHGRIPVGTPTVDPFLLEKYAAPEPRKRWWAERILRTHAHIH